MRYVGPFPLPLGEAGRRTAANRGAYRSEFAAFRTIDVVESARLARAAGRAACDSDRARAAVCGADLLASGTESDAGIASGGTRAPRPFGIRTNLRVRHGVPFWWSGRVDERCDSPRGVGP